MTVDPFDPKTALLAKHAQHVVFIHFPIALFLSGVAFDLIAQRSKRHTVADAAYYNLLGAAISTLPTLITGILAWQFQLEGQKLKGVLLLHLVFRVPIKPTDRIGLVVAFSSPTLGQRAPEIPHCR